MYIPLFPSTEGIKQQNLDFFNELVKTINDLKNEQSRLYKWANYEAGKIAAIINKHTNSNVEVQFSDYLTAFNSKELGGSIHEIYKDPKFVIEGGVDLTNGKLTGSFSRHRSRIFLEYWLFTENLVSEEVAAIILHEVGHMVTFYYRISKLFILSNWALKDITDKFNDNSSVKEKKIYLTRLSSKLNKKQMDIDKLSKASDLTTFTALLVSDVMEEMRSDTGMMEYDIISDEFLADQYATKHGAGLYLITGLDKIGARRKRDQSDYYAAEIVPFLITTTAAIFSPIAGLILLSAWVYTYSPMDNRQRYNNPEDRLKRIRMQIISRLMDEKLPKTIRNQAREQLDGIDETIKITKDKFYMMERLWMIFHPFLRKRVKAEELQLQLERLALNDLFIKAYDLKQLINFKG